MQGSDARWPAPAKLNLFLHITGRRADGRHELQTLFRLLDYGDELRFALRRDARVRVHCSMPRGAAAGRAGAMSGDASSDLAVLAGEDNLAHRAARLLQRRCRVRAGVDVRLRKRTPLGAGLGGGSSDAATTLCALNRLWNCGLDGAALMRLGATLGADVPAFIYGRSAWAEGVGDRLAPAALAPAWYAVLAPPVRVATARAYADPALTRACPSITMEEYLAGRRSNVFEAVVKKRFPEVARLMRALAGQGVEPRLTGSGAGVFVECATRAEARAALRAAPRGAAAGFVARGLERSPLPGCAAGAAA